MCAEDGQAPFNVSDSSVEFSDSQRSITAHCDPDRYPGRWVQLSSRLPGLYRKLLLLADDSLDLVANPNLERTGGVILRQTDALVRSYRCSFSLLPKAVDSFSSVNTNP